MQTTVGVFHDRRSAEQAARALRRMGAPDADISYANTEAMSMGRTSTVGSATLTGAVVGALIGVVAGLIVAAGALVGLGTLFVATPIITAIGITGAAATTLGAALTGAIAGAIIGALVGLGSKDNVMARDAADARHNSDVIVTTHTDDPKAKDVLKDYGAESINEYGDRAM